MPQSEESKSTASEYARTLSPADLQVYGRPYGFNGTQLSICIPSTPQAALRSTFSRFRRASRSARRLRKATVAVRERGVAHGDAPEPLRRVHHIGVRLGIDRGIYG
jgi:hypothetical protein